VARLSGDPALRVRLAQTAEHEVQGRTWSRVVDELVARHYAAVVRPPVRTSRAA
jgi:hypothetical protein